jgi:hypothetical protein
VSRFLISCARDDHASATTLISCGTEEWARDHSWRNSLTVRWKYSSGDFQGFNA